MDIVEVVDARKTRIEVDAAWDLLRAAAGITTVKGKNVRIWDPKVDDQAEILKQVIGPSGNLRAPTCRIKEEFVVGFNPEVYEQLLKR